MPGVTQLVIKAYADEAFTTEQGEFTTPVNPSNLRISSGVTHHVLQGMGLPGAGLQYHTSPPRLLAFSLFLDQTGVMGSQGTTKDVVASLAQLASVVYDFQDSSHAPYYIRVIWGTTDFKGRLSKMDIHHTLFDQDGTPIRVEVDLEILEHFAKPQGSKEETQEAGGGPEEEQGAPSAESAGDTPADPAAAHTEAAGATPPGVDGLRGGLDLPGVSLPNPLLLLLMGMLSKAQKWGKKKVKKAKAMQHKFSKRHKDKEKEK